MQNILPTVFIIIALIIGLVLGIILGSILGRTGSVQILAFIIRIPRLLIKSPRKLKSNWKMWRELRDSRTIELRKNKKRITELKEQIAKHKTGIKNINAQIRRAKWEFSEPKEH